MPKRSPASRRSRGTRASCPRSSPRTRSAGCCHARFPTDRSSSRTCRAAATRTSRRCAPRWAGRPTWMPDLEAALRARREGGGHAFIPYVTGGLEGVDADLLRGLADAGADAIEIGIPFSDPVMDGRIIQEASRRALESGTRPADVLATVKEAGVEVPVAVMTYFNPVLRHGVEAFLRAAAEAGVAGVIVPDLPVDEAEDVARACRETGVAPVLLAAPGSSSERLRSIAGLAGGFVYCVATYGATGERETLAG